MVLRILDIIEGTSVDGPGLRTAIYIAGCHHQCPGCHNPDSWDFHKGHSMSLNKLVEIIKENDFNVTLTGGDPLYHPIETSALCQRIKSELNKTIWCYTGFTWEEITSDKNLQTILPWVDVIVDGPFISSQKDTSLRFRGSTNQRIIDVHASLAAGHIEECIEFYQLPLHLAFQ